MTERIEESIPEFEWKPGDNIVIYCKTHKAIVFKGDMESQTGLRVMKARLQEHEYWWAGDRHEMHFAAPEDSKMLPENPRTLDN